jgi:myo-inositol catabolism protein IolC
MAKKERGYTKQLLVLPFDHRGSFQSKMFGIHGTPTPEQTKEIASYKTVIYEGFEKAVRSGLPREIMGVLVDEQFGSEVIQRAKAAGFTLCVAAEKSGQDEFDFEYQDYGAHIEKHNPDLVKVLVRYNPEGEKALNLRQSSKLKELSDYLDRSNRKFMFELLVPATEEQLTKCKGDKKLFDVEIRPALMIRAIHELQDAGIEADVWKLEGLDRKEDFEKVCVAARRGGRDHVACIVLGRGENEAKVREWLKVGANVRGVIGFAVGRTVFWEPLKGLKEKKWSREEASDQISKLYGSLCKLWLEARA